MTKILLVEDDKSLREIYGVRLLAEGYDIVSAGDGEEALAMAIKDRPALIVSDVMMPKISGFDMLDILRSTTETRNIKVIMMTALSSEDQRKRGEQLGADRYLVKSQVGIEDVVRTVHDVLEDTPNAPAAFSQGSNVPSTFTPPSFSQAPSSSQPTATPSFQPAPSQPPQSVAPFTPAPQTPQPVPPSQAPSYSPAPEPAASQPFVAAPTPVAFNTAPSSPSSFSPFGQANTQSNSSTGNLPQPTAPFSTPRPNNLAARVIEPFSTPTLTTPSVSELIQKELDSHTDVQQPTMGQAAPSTPSPSSPPSSFDNFASVQYEETPRPSAIGSTSDPITPITPSSPAQPAPAAPQFPNSPQL